ncbi:hypothetical protein EXIGLDRAFT_747246 [Exidia glandulosa HHB12029]|uniref:F-box domain-containing protein n=1 Tax=Exidia glandulosa HHB12029 TaxID=1314781 RepID=A0A165KYI9_EXIGL|nr:hypothetical protein EXIGLDRAFT_747246 [Exidia glandulosa HHB12029]
MTPEERDTLHNSLGRQCERVWNRYSLFPNDSLDRHAACHDALVALMRAHIDIVRSAHQQFCARLNARAPVMRVPDEVLLAICSTLPAQARVAATHVCQRWRRTLLGAAGMWTSIELQGVGDLHALPELLHRAGFAPVDVTCWGTLTAEQFVEALHCIGPHMNHVRSLRINARELYDEDNEEIADGPYTVRFQPAPMLQQLVIQWPYVNTDLYISWDNASATEFTQLRHVELLKLPDVSFVRLFSAVQALSFTVPHELALKRLNDVVQHCPQLRALSVHLITGRLNEHHMDVDQPRRDDYNTGPRLDSLTITTTSYSEQQALRLLEFVGSGTIASIQITAPNYVTTHETLRELVPELDGIETARVHEEFVHFADRRRFTRSLPIIGPRELAPHGMRFNALRDLVIELTAWAQLSGAGLVLPSLRHLTVNGDAVILQHRAGWPACPALHDVTYALPCAEDAEDQHLSDAFDFVGAIPQCPRPLPHLVVVGITPDYNDDIVFGSLENLVQLALGERREFVDKLEVRERADAGSA